MPTPQTLRQGITLPSGDQVYDCIQYDSSNGAGDQKEFSFAARGRYVYVAEIDGPGPVYLQLNTKPSRLMRLAEGQVFEIPLEAVTLLMLHQSCAGLSNGYADTIYTRAILYTSSTPIVRVPERDFGLKRGFWCGDRLNSTPSGVPLFQDLMPAGGGRLFTFGKRGAVLWVTNEDSSVAIRLAYYSAAAGAAFAGGFGHGFPIWPKQTIPFALSSRMVVALGSAGGGGLVGYEGPIISADSGAPIYSYLISGLEADLTDLNTKGKQVVL